MVDARKASLSLTGLTLLVLAVFAGCGSDEAQTNPFIDARAPEIPLELNATRAPDGAVRLDWVANSVDPDLAGYIVYRSSSPDRGYEPVNQHPVVTNAFIDDQVQGSRGYWYAVASRDVHQNESPRSENTHVGPRGEPARPSGN
jgi:hypothetical protein